MIWRQSAILRILPQLVVLFNKKGLFDKCLSVSSMGRIVILLYQCKLTYILLVSAKFCILDCIERIFINRASFIMSKKTNAAMLFILLHIAGQHWYLGVVIVRRHQTVIYSFS